MAPSTVNPILGDRAVAYVRQRATSTKVHPHSAPQWPAMIKQPFVVHEPITNGTCCRHCATWWHAPPDASSTGQPSEALLSEETRRTTSPVTDDLPLRRGKLRHRVGTCAFVRGVAHRRCSLCSCDDVATPSTRWRRHLRYMTTGPFSIPPCSSVRLPSSGPCTVGVVACSMQSESVLEAACRLRRVSQSGRRTP